MHNFSHAQNISKKVCRSPHGIVVSQHRQVSEVGANILREGGNAIDAAIAVSFALGALEPWMSGLGGGGYMVCRFAKDNDVKVIDFGMRSPSGLNPADYPIVEGEANDLFPWPKVKNEANVIGATSIAIPGVVAGMQTAFENYATFDWKKLVQPAIDFAKKGILIDWYTQLILSGSGVDIARFDKTSEIFLDENKRPKVGSWVLTNENRIILNELAHTLETLRDLGGDAFYHGELAENIVAEINAEGGCFHISDLNSYKAKLLDPLVTHYSGGSIYVTPEMTAGPTLMNVMNALTHCELDPGHPDVQSFSAYAQSLLNAYSDRLLNMGDTSADVQNEGCTSHFNIVDKDGNMVSVTQTLLSIFGSKLTLPSSGILMNNGIMWFDPEQGKRNSLQPAKRCLSNMCPVYAHKEDKHYVLGAAGGRRILSAVCQILSFLFDYNMSLEEALHLNRIDVSGNKSVLGNEKLNRDIHKALSEKFEYSQAYWTAYPHNFGIPSIAMHSVQENQGMADVMSPWSDAVAEDENELRV